MSKTNKEKPSSPSDTAKDRKQLGARLRKAREYLGISQHEAAKFLTIPRSGLSHIESGQRRIDALELKRLAELYKQPVSYFTGETRIDEGMPDDVAHLARAAAGLSESDRGELARFAEYLRARSKSERTSSDD